MSTSERAVVPYPWSGMSGTLIAELNQYTESEACDRAFDRLSQTTWAGLPDDTVRIGRLNLQAMAAWLRGERRMIRISEASRFLLNRVGEQRLAARRWPARWFDMPRPGQSLYAEPLVLVWEGLVRGGRPVMTYIRARGLPTEEHINYLHWEVAENDVLWGTAPNIPFEMQSSDFRSLWEQAKAIILASPEERNQLDETGHTLLPEQVRLLIHSVNVVAALNEQHDLRLLRTGKGADKRGRARAGSVKVQSFDLDESGLNVWVKRYEAQDRASPVSPPVMKPHASPATHYRREHTARVWVNRQRPEEQVLGEKDGKVLVRRPRRGGVVGSGELALKQQRLRTGIEDLRTANDN